MKRKKNEEHKESQIHIFSFAFYIKSYILLESIVREKSSLYHHILFTVFYELNDIWNAVMIHQSLIEINIQIII